MEKKESFGKQIKRVRLSNGNGLLLEIVSKIKKMKKEKMRWLCYRNDRHGFMCKRWVFESCSVFCGLIDNG